MRDGLSGSQTHPEATPQLFDLLAGRAGVGEIAAARSEHVVGDARFVLNDPGHGWPRCVTALVRGTSQWQLPAGYQVRTSPSGGYLLLDPGCAESTRYWIPFSPRRLKRDAKGRLLSVQPEVVSGVAAADGQLTLHLEGGDGETEIVVWALPGVGSPDKGSALERSAWYMLGSHTVVGGRVDVYRHMVSGTVFENRVAWPNQWRVFSENDAHALHLILGGWVRASGDPMLRALREQVMQAVLARQSEDGGFRHGEWTQVMESHYRLHCSAMHLMMDALAESDDPSLSKALSAAAGFLARQVVSLGFGHWVLHDELEHSVELMKLGPFKWVPSTVFDKAESNMLVLNSHLDGLIALDRYAEVSGDRQFEPLVTSGRASTRAVLELKPAQALYRGLMWLIELTFLPAERARALPVWKRALKRLSWKYLIPRLPDIKSRFPRLVMPGGYIDRELSLRTWANDYHAINLMDLARYLRRFDEPVVRKVLQDGLAFTRRSGILERWRELDYQKYALGFWAEALYHVCTVFPNAAYRHWLAEAMLVLEEMQMGQPPSLLGANPEAVPVLLQTPCPEPADQGLRVANLGRRGAPELLVVNAGTAPRPLVWARPPVEPVHFVDADGRPAGDAPVVPAGGWLWGRAGG